MYNEHALPSGEVLTITSEGDHPNKPWQVTCWAADGEHRWTKDFDNELDAQAEFVRFQ